MEWKVIKSRIELMPHHNADSLELGKIENFQVVVQKGLYKDGDIVVFAPEKSILTGKIKQEFEKYLSGTNKNRVKSVRLRDEISSGIIIPKHLIDFDLRNVDFNVDISERLGITKYEPPIPQQLSGQVNAFNDNIVISKHDCEQFGVFKSQLQLDERILVTEKIHGSQGIFILSNNIKHISSKGLFKSGLTIKESLENSYWQSSYNSNLWEILENISKENNNAYIQVFGEILPIQKGFNYGLDKMTVKIFELRINNEYINLDIIKEKYKDLYNLWVPLLYDGVFDEELFYLLKEGKEQVSGKELHIKEGVVIQPFQLRKDFKNNIYLKLKLLNSKYKDTGEEFN